MRSWLQLNRRTLNILGFVVDCGDDCCGSIVDGIDDGDDDGIDDDDDVALVPSVLLVLLTDRYQSIQASIEIGV